MLGSRPTQYYCDFILTNNHNPVSKVCHTLRPILFHFCFHERNIQKPLRGGRPLSRSHSLSLGGNSRQEHHSNKARADGHTCAHATCLLLVLPTRGYTPHELALCSHCSWRCTASQSLHCFHPVTVLQLCAVKLEYHVQWEHCLLWSDNLVSRTPGLSSTARHRSECPLHRQPAHTGRCSCDT